MQSILNCIKKNNLIKNGDIIGIAVSGGSDSMALLHFLFTHRKELDIEVVALHLDHGIRETSMNDAEFVSHYCQELGIRLVKTRVDVPRYCQQKGVTVEQGARECRYQFFESMISKGIVDRIALAHHNSDQAETILMHIFRGSGLAGAVGMEYQRDLYIRPMLNTDKYEIMSYINANYIEYVTDETNMCNDYNRNFIRNQIFPLLKERYPNVERAISNFGKSCKEDNDFIKSQVPYDCIIKEKNTARIPLSYFVVYEPSQINRIIFRALNMIGIYADIERKHIELIKDLANYSENGSKIDLPNGLNVYKEYEYISLTSKRTHMQGADKPLKSGKITFDNFGTITVKKTNNLDYNQVTHMIDAKKLPKGVVWRYRRDGDIFEKFGGSKKKLKSFLIDQKIPARIRDQIPVLASGDQIYVVAGLEIANSVRIDESTKVTYSIIVEKDN